MEQEDWTINLLDGLRAKHGDVELTSFGTRKNAALLAYLAHDLRSQHRRELLIQMLWTPRYPSTFGQEAYRMADDRAKNSLHQGVSALRQYLEKNAGLPTETVIISTPDYIQLNPAHVKVDIDQFEEFDRQAHKAEDPHQRAEIFRSAADLYKKDLFIFEWEDDHYSDRRNQLGTTCDLLLRKTATAFRDIGDLSTAIFYARRAMTHDLESEEARRLLIELYANAREMTLARKECEALEAMCREELGQSPSEASVELIRRIRSNHFLSLPPEVDVQTAPDVNVDLPTARFAQNWDYPVTGLLGREDDIKQLNALLRPLLAAPTDSATQDETISASRLVTLTGLGGVGKTRLALEAVRQLSPVFQGRVIFLPLATVTDVATLFASLADALNIGQPQVDRELERINAALGDDPVLLVLDRLEHMVPAIGVVVMTLLHRLPAMTCLATSRVALGVDGERPFPVRPLPVPDSDGPHTPQELLGLAGVRMFVSRRPGCEVNAENADTISGICRMMEGIPLALEIAAGAVGLSLRKILSRLQNDRFDPTINGRVAGRDSSESIVAIISSTYDRLPTDLKRFFKRLTVFEQGWCVESAAAVCEEVLAETYLVLLQERSLIARDERGGELRYRMLDTVRDFGQRVQTDAEKPDIARRHAEYLLRWLDEDNSPPNVALRWVAQEQGNFQAALRWCLDEEADVDLGLRIASRVAPYWQILQRFSEARRWLEKAYRLSRTVLDRERANALRWAGILAAQQGDFDIAISSLEEGRRIFTEPRDRVHLAGLLNSLGNAYAGKGDFAHARAAMQESITLYQEEKIPIAAAQGLMNLGNQSEKLGDYSAAEEYHKQALSIQLRERNNPDLQDPYGVLEDNIARTIMNMGNVALAQGHYEKANSCYEESFQLSEREGDLMSMATARHNQGTLAYVEERDHEARQLYTDSLKWRRELGDMSGVASTLSHLALLDCQTGDYSSAAASLTESLGIAWRIDERETLIHALNITARLAAAEGQPEWSARLWGGSDRLREELGLRELNTARDQEATVVLGAVLRSLLGENGFELANGRGRETPLERLVLDALETLPVLPYKIPEAGASGS